MPGRMAAPSPVDALRHVVDASAPFSSTRFLWFGNVSEDLPEHVRPVIIRRPEIARSYLIDRLTGVLYRNFYQTGRAVPASTSDTGVTTSDDPAAFVRALSQANCGVDSRQPGWVVHRADDDGTLRVQRDGLMLRARAEDLADSSQEHNRSGEFALRLPAVLPDVSPGFVTVLGREPLDRAAHPVVRLYWNLQPWSAVDLISELTGRLNGANLPFQLKVVNHPGRYVRCDAAVLYLHAGDLHIAGQIVSSVYASVRVGLKSPVPALTLRLAPGLGLAEEPAGGESFGMHRCGLVAEGLLRGWERGADASSERLAVVLETLRAAGVDPEWPYLNPGSTDVHSQNFVVVPSSGTPVAPRDESTTLPDTRRFLDVASQIGEEIYQTAFWHEDRCNWLGTEPYSPERPSHVQAMYSSLGPELYGGSSGVALFLAELAVATGDRDAERTAIGAMRRALDQAPHVNPLVDLGLFTGTPGLAFAAVMTGRLLGDERLVSGGIELATSIGASVDSDRELDLLGGASGGIVALLRLAEMTGEARFVDTATVLGEVLASRAVCDEHGCSWASPSAPGMPHLTGLSHGAAGIGVALFELWHVTRDERFRVLGNRAFDFERRWFDRARGNWPDHRAVGMSDLAAGRTLPYAEHWCHGAPGIALSRLRAWQLTGDARFRDEAIVALDTTYRSVLLVLEDGTTNFSLCHGLAGNAEILQRGSDVLGAGFDHFTHAATAVAHAGIRLYAPAGREWPAGAYAGWTPGLMLGTAGIGRFFLYLAGNARSCMLLPGLS